jgi:arylsulfatase A-like enzyme
MKSAVFSLVILIGSFSSFGFAKTFDNNEKTGSQSNIILIITDDQGYGDLGIHNQLIKTPVLDKLAKQSVQLTNFHVDPTCSPTRAALMTGKYSINAGVWHTVMGRHMLASKHVTVAEVLKDAGYKTAMIGKWHLGDNYPFRPQDQGFDHVLMHGGGGVGQSPDHWGNTQFDDSYYLNGRAKAYEGYATDIWFDEAISYVNRFEGKSDPFFLYISTNAPHVPYRAPKSYVDQYLEVGLPRDMAMFYAMITNIDFNIGRLIARTEAAGILDNTIFIFMTDNGSSLAMQSDGEPLSMLSDELLARLNVTSSSLNLSMRGGKNSVYEGGHRVPFFIKFPNKARVTPRTIGSLTAHIDVMPTLLQLASLEYSPSDFDGISLADTLLANERIPDRTLVVTNQRVLNPTSKMPFAVMRNDWRYVKSSQKGDFELFNVSSDPSQTQDVIGEYPEIADNLAETYKRWWESVSYAGFETTRIILGSDHENPSRITGHDWHAKTTSNSPWWPGFEYNKDRWSSGWIGKEDAYVAAPWQVFFSDDGRYTFDLYLHDKSAKKPVKKEFAHLKLNDQVLTKKISVGDTHASFETDAIKGQSQIMAWFDDGDDQAIPAFFLYVEKLD